MNLENEVLTCCKLAKKASYALSIATSREKNDALKEVSLALKCDETHILIENVKDLEYAKTNGLSPAMIDRLTLTTARLDEIIHALKDLINLADPVGITLEKMTRPNGIEIEKISVPIGVIGIIYEARPNVTVDAAMLCLKASNTVILRGGKDAFFTNLALVEAIKKGLKKSHISEDIVQFLPTIDRQAMDILLKQDAYIDLIIPRGGESLIRAVVEKSTIPVIKHYKGVCHLFIDKSANLAMSLAIIEDAKTQRPSACNSIETVLIEQDFFDQHANTLKDFFKEKKITVFGCPIWQTIDALSPLSTELQLRNEFLNTSLNVRIVFSLIEAIEHINEYGSAHSDCIITQDTQHAEIFLNKVQSAVVYHNASTRFTDGGEFGFGSEIGISTDKLHARGPMGLKELCSYQYRVRGKGQIRSLLN